ncbi:dephospho-CoA kinase [Deinococcus peraridilitoris]|uniref:Dephospho-CoA kinase n=1 Tax=Deinococcus peraridilitoris (strain DSM 19664 / LMG 22246 / CIP 109416 / KR-200) TaxID=937777 RepID=L0A6P1_DEIPD|nr:dephospho-CoA kinase [Deinococcus peraridilitoris]AFZ68857.1 dephospho-CoA kinase [Deinococcus peraridilitoris DSM 19664]
MAPRRLGLTGSIGAGKSTVAHLLRARGFTVLDADVVAHEISASVEVTQAVEAAFGSQYLKDGALDRSRLAELVFNHPEQRKQLNRIIHPRVRARMTELEREASGEWIVQDIPLLFENGLDAQMDATLLVDAPLELRVARVLARGGLSRDDILKRDAAQLSGSEKRRRASMTLDNDGDLAQLERRLDQVLDALKVRP